MKKEVTLGSTFRTPHSAFRILVNAGPTREYFDSVRFISNPSTGKQGFAIARAAAAQDHSVVLVTGPVSLEDVPGVEMIRVTSAVEMATACKAAFENCDAAILTAAVCDYRPAIRSPHKLKKADQQLQITLEPTEDICAALSGIKGGRIVIGFSMDDQNVEANAERKLARKQCDAIVQNELANIGSDRATIKVLTLRGGWGEPVVGTKDQIAEHVISILRTLIANPGAPPK